MIINIEQNQLKNLSSVEDLTHALQEKGIRPSYQRIRILECLYKKDGHPTVDEIYQVLSPEIPSLAKATIYNTLHTFVQAGLARTVNIDENELRYDGTLSPHGHFKCESCGTIYNFGINIDSLSISGLDRFQINEKNVSFKGICPTCLSIQSKPDKE